MSTERKGLLLPKQEEFVATVLDNWFKFKNAFVEKFDRIVFLNIVRAADNMGASTLPQAWRDDLIPLIDAAMGSDYETVRLLTVDILNKRIDIKQFDDYQELIVFDALTKFLAASIDYYINKKQAV